MQAIFWKLTTLCFAIATAFLWSMNSTAERERDKCWSDAGWAQARQHTLCTGRTWSAACQQCEGLNSWCDNR